MVYNGNASSVTTIVDVLVDGKVEHRVPITNLAGKASQIVQVVVRSDVPGIHTVRVGSLTGQFTVREELAVAEAAPVATPEPAAEPSVAAEPSAGMNIGLIIALAVGAVVILGGLAYFFVPGIRKRNSA